MKLFVSPHRQNTHFIFGVKTKKLWTLKSLYYLVFTINHWLFCSFTFTKKITTSKDLCIHKVIKNINLVCKLRSLQVRLKETAQPQVQVTRIFSGSANISHWHQIRGGSLKKQARVHVHMYSMSNSQLSVDSTGRSLLTLH